MSSNSNSNRYEDVGLDILEEQSLPSQYEPNIRVLPPHPLGGTPALSATQLTDLGAMAAALGMERSAVTGFIRDVQDLAANVTLQSAQRLLERVRVAQHARLESLMQAIRALPSAPAPGMLEGFSSQAALIRAGYVSRDSVLALIQAIDASSLKG